ncbi:MAG: hypothetical protein WBV55_18830 [Candidatus Sulfotelmatobacter sp.]
MVENNPPALPDLARPSVIPLPTALYVSGELIFELYDGGQPRRRFSIRWDRFVPGKESEAEAATQSSQALLHTHQD